MRQHNNLLISAISSIAALSSVNAATALIDFGTANAASPYNTAPLLGGASTGNIALNDTTTTATGWTVNVTENGNGNGGNAGAGANVSSFPTALNSFSVEALQDSIFANGNAASMVLTLSGLNTTLTYDLLLYGSRGNAQSAEQTWTLNEGSGASPLTHASGLNSTTAVDWTSLLPNGSGVIEVTITNAGAGALALNFASITENAVPEPSSALLCSLAGLSLLARRR